MFGLKVVSVHLKAVGQQLVFKSVTIVTISFSFKAYGLTFFFFYLIYQHFKKYLENVSDFQLIYFNYFSNVYNLKKTIRTSLFKIS